MAEGAEAGGWGEMENGLKGAGIWGRGGSGGLWAKGAEAERKGEVVDERGQGEVADERRVTYGGGEKYG